MKVAGKAISRIPGVIVIVCSLWLVAVAQEDISIRIDRIAGSVEVRNVAEDGPWTEATAKSRISSGWHLRTAAESKVQLVFPRDNVVILKENSVLYVDSLDAGGGAKVDASEGSLLVNIQNALAPGSDFELQTPTALAVVRGTKYGVEDIDQYDAEFYGYSGITEIFDIYDVDRLYPVHLVEDTTVLTNYGEQPGDPVPSNSDAAEFLQEMEDPTPFDEAELLMLALAEELGVIDRQLDAIIEQLDEIEPEWNRYERNDQVTHLTFLYAQLLAVQDLTDTTGELFESVLDEISADDLPVNIDPVPALINAISEKLNAIRERLGAMMDDAGGVIIDDEDVLETLRGLIDPGNPALGLRWGLIDTDNDGISDLDEIALGLDPMANNAGDFIILVDPPDGEEVEYPDTDAVTFEFEELDTEFIESYNLILQSGGVQWQRRDVDSMEDVDLLPLLVSGGVFADRIDPDGSLDLEWFVTADIEASQLFQQVAAANPGFRAGLGNTIASEVRLLSIQTPVQQDVVILDLELTGPGTVIVGRQITLRGVISEVTALGEWKIEVVYDASMLSYDDGRRLGLFSGSTVFFGDEPGGIVSISGTAQQLSGGLTGEGDLFELVFTATDDGSTTIEVDNIELTSITGVVIDSEPGDEVDIDLTVSVQTARYEGNTPFDR